MTNALTKAHASPSRNIKQREVGT